ncbi:hypothetical protein BBK82_05135 [Lentzea guizhouensis]|uniref:Uncharacterized protein n=1 Tax=Lentzea guizhouensis TaxID=1586287 RepID=A0A1B2HCU5_9PSEU|nr:hypothetical protein [Lentzea guizhouensis]ANZ35557.1 hypothetical protein BBK82_05135 [Lentzea guizhouensis]
MAERLWFGQALRWSRESGFWYAVGRARRRHAIVRITATEAKSYGHKFPAGWYLAEHPDSPGGGELGPRLGHDFRRAKEAAEVWLLAPAADRLSGECAPGLLTTVQIGATTFVAADGRSLSAWPVPWEACIEIRDDAGTEVGRVAPWFQYEDGEVSALQWIARAAATRLAPQPTYHAAVRAVGHELVHGVAGGGHRG